MARAFAILSLPTVSRKIDRRLSVGPRACAVSLAASGNIGRQPFIYSLEVFI
jgi:hypothetical protein